MRPSPFPSTAYCFHSLGFEAERAGAVEFAPVHPAAEVRLEAGDRGQRPDAAAAEAVAGGGVLEGAEVGGGDFVAVGGGGAAAQHLQPRRHGGDAGRPAAEDGRVAARVGQHLGDVPVGVVVGEDRVVGVGGHPGRAQVAGGGEDRVFGVVGVLHPVPVGVDSVGFPGRGHELHPADGAGGGDVEVGAEGGLDLVDPGQHRGALGAEVVGRRRPLVDRHQDRRDPGRRAGRRGDGGDRERLRRARPGSRRGAGRGLRRRCGGSGLRPLLAAARRGAAAAGRLRRLGRGTGGASSVLPCTTGAGEVVVLACSSGAPSASARAPQ